MLNHLMFKDEKIPKCYISLKVTLLLTCA